MAIGILGEKEVSGWAQTRLSCLLREVDVRAASIEEHERNSLQVLSLTKNKGLVPQTERFRKRIATEDVSRYKVVRKGWIVYNPYVIWEGAVHALTEYEAGLVSPAYLVWETTERDDGFLDFLLRTPVLIAEYDRLCAGAVNRRRSIRKIDFMNIEIALPSLEERRAIARVLHAIQNAKQTTERVIDATLELKKSLMRYLFMYGPVPMDEADNVTLKETEIGCIPENWGVCRLGDVCGVRYGLGQPPGIDSDGVPMLRATNIKRGRIDENGLLRVKRAAIPQNRNPYLKCGDILVVRSGAYTGDVAMITEQWEGCIAGYDLVVSPGKAMDAKCCSYNLLSEQAQRYFRSQRDRSAQPHLNRGQLENTLIPLADIGEQHKIANILDAFDTKLASEEAYMSALSQLFESLLHRLMTGRIRLPEFAGGD